MNQSATVFSNDPQTPEIKITITGSIKQSISIEPSARVLLQGYPGEKVEKKVTITSFEEKPLTITSITSTLENKIKYKLKTIEKGRVYSLEIKTTSGIKESFQGKITLQTSSQKKPSVEIPVIGKVKSK